MLFVLRGFRIALLTQDGFSKLLAAGLTFGFALQTFIIVGGILRLIPLTGITLPFVSYGGSSVVANFLLLAGLLLVSNRANREPRGEQADPPASRVVALVLIVALIVGTTYWQTWANGGPRRPAGQRRSSASRSSRSTAARSTPPTARRSSRRT